MQVVISSAFESGIGLAQYACLAHAVNQLPIQQTVSPPSFATPLQNTSTSASSSCLPGSFAHGLATESWFQRSCHPGLVQVLGRIPSATVTAPDSLSEDPARPQSQRMVLSLQAAHKWLSLACCTFRPDSNAVDIHSHSQQDFMWSSTLGFASQCIDNPREACQLASRCLVETEAGCYDFHVSRVFPPSTMACNTEAEGLGQED